MDVQELLAKRQMLYLSRSDLIDVGLLDYAAIVADVRRGLSLHITGDTLLDKLALDFDVDKDWKVSALVGVIGDYAGVKWLGANVDNLKRGFPRSNSIISLSDRQTGRVLGVMDGALISALRTGAYAALAMEALGGAKPAVVGILGAGVISRCVLLCLGAAVRDRISRVLVYDHVPEVQEQFAQLMSEETGLAVEAVASPGEMVRRSEVTISATTAMAPLIKLADVQPGATHIHLGGWEDEKAYVVACARPPNKIICDDVDLVIHRNVQTVAYAFHEGLIGRDDFYGNLGEILLGQKPGREGEELIYFNAVGLPILDVGVASRLFENALEKNAGLLLSPQEPHWILSGQRTP
jgi:ornithine cyclodeaminase/alanine dehydrogenase-like protein (mu-crystallin family)